MSYALKPGSMFSTARLAILALVVTFSVGCSTVTLISDYDDETDKQLTALQQSTDTFITKMLAEIPKSQKAARSPKNAYDAQKTFYTEFDEKLRKLEFRVQSFPKNSKTQKLVSDIRAAVLLREEEEESCEKTGILDADKSSSLQALHCLAENKAQGPRRLSLEVNQRNVNQVIGAALALELAKKQGSESNK
jgi:hypothetical protein